MDLESASTGGGQWEGNFCDGAAAIEHSPWPMAAVEGPHHVVSYVNAAFSRMMNQPPASFIGKPYSDAIEASAEWLKALDRVFHTGQTESHSEPGRAAQPGPLHTATLWPLTSDGHPVGVMIQVTDPVNGHAQIIAMNEALILGAVRQNELAEEADRARAEAEAANSAKDRFMAVLSHELRTPLTPILMAVHTLALRKDLPPAFARALSMIERNVKFEAQLIDEMLDFTSISHGKMILAREAIDLRAVLRHAVEMVAPTVGDKHQHLSVAFDDADHLIFGDGVRLRQVFANLLRNASKFTPEGGDIWLRSRQAEGNLTVEVSDTGVGFSAEASERIFEAFIQASEAVTREFGGLGLGLAISRAILLAHGGTLRAHSPGAGQGATFTTELPLPESA